MENVPSVVGIIWNGDDKPLTFTVNENGNIHYVISPSLDKWVRDKAFSENILLGDMVDILNRHISDFEQQQNPYRVGMEVTFTLGKSETKRFAEWFGVDLTTFNDRLTK